MGVPGAEQDRCSALGDCREAFRKGIQSGQSQLRIDHILARNVMRIGRNPTLLRHQRNQLALPPGPLGIEPEQHPRIAGREEPVTPQTLLTGSGHGPGKPRGKKMGAQGTGTQHVSDRDRRNGRMPTERGNTAQLA